MKKIKEILIFCILVIVIGIAMATVVIKIEQKSNEDNADKENINSESTSNITPTEDALRFKKEYEDVNGMIREKDGMLFNNVDIPEQNPIQYINIDEFVDILNNKSGIVFLSSPTCPYCRASISSLLKAAKELKMTTIYYYDISKDENETDSENEIQELKRYGIITENEEGKNAWKIPQLLNIKDKNVLFTIEWGGSACRLGPGDVVLARRELGYRPAQRDQLRQRLAHPLAALAHGRTTGL